MSAQKLWLACLSLRNAIELGNIGGFKRNLLVQQKGTGLTVGPGGIVQAGISCFGPLFGGPTDSGERSITTSFLAF